MSKSTEHLSAKVKDFMEAPPIVVSEDTTIDQAASTMWEKRIGSVIVVDKEGKMVGILTASDIIFAVTKSLVGREVPVSSIMSKTSIIASPNESVLTAVERMMKENVRHLPVIEKNGTPLGIISTRDTMSIFEPLLKFVFRSKKTATTKKATTKKKAATRKATKA
ncbi:MAG TPA: CBS domain-containing protein [Nitrososphaerales archaeon]|nr:CBS domain-containing protein [Nitrososphaerales archaeon]